MDCNNNYDKTREFDEFSAELRERCTAASMLEVFALIVHELKVHMVPPDEWPAIFETINDSAREKMKDYDVSQGDVISYMRPYVKKAIFEEKKPELRTRQRIIAI